MTQSLGRTARHLIAGVAALVVLACATTQFDRAYSARKWADASSALGADSSLLDSESTLYRAAMLYSFPDRSTYDPARARALFERLLRLYPATTRHQSVVDQLSLLYELEKSGNASIANQQELQARIEQLASDTLRLRRSVDSIAAQLRVEQDQNATLRKASTRLAADLQDRESQIRVLHSELSHLKAIDLKPRPRSQPGDTTQQTPRGPE